MPLKPRRLGLWPPRRMAPRYNTLTPNTPSTTLTYPLLLRIQAPDGRSPTLRKFDTPDTLHRYVKGYKRAILKAFASSTEAEQYFGPPQYRTLNSNLVYAVHSPFHTSEMDDRTHNQIADRPFEAKCRRALSTYLSCKGDAITEQERILYRVNDVDGSEKGSSREMAVEWDGLYTNKKGTYYVLECKHLMTSVFTIDLLVLTDL